MHPGAFAVHYTRIWHCLAKAHIKRVHHAVRRMKPAERLQDDLVHGTGGLAVNRRTGNALAGQRHASTQQKGHCRSIMQSKYHRVLTDPLYLEEGPQRAEYVDHF